MAKAKSIFVCSDCGYESPKWLGKCPACNAWNTLRRKSTSCNIKSERVLILKKKQNL